MSIFVMREIEVMGMTWIIVPNSGDSDRMWSACKPWQRKAPEMARPMTSAITECPLLRASAKASW